jgi:ABC-type transporter Mla MlaB component
MTQEPLSQSTAFSIERKQGKAPSTVIFHLSGPFTVRSMYGSLTPIELRNMLNFQSMPGEQPPLLNIIDLTDVPYMDSSGLGMIVTHYVHCQGKGIKLLLAGVCPRVIELFKMTKVETTLPMVATVEQADIP